MDWAEAVLVGLSVVVGVVAGCLACWVLWEMALVEANKDHQ